MSGALAMPLWTDAYLGDTRHLTTVEHGAYLLILMAMWRAGGSLPNDEVRLARTAGLALDKWRRIAPNVLELLTVEGDQITQKRLKQELESALSRAEKRRLAQSAGGRAKALKAKEPPPADSSAEKMVRARTDQEPRTKSVSNETQKRASADWFSELWDVFPKRVGESPRKPAFQKFEALLRRGHDPAAIIAAARAYAARCEGYTDRKYVKQLRYWLSDETWMEAEAAPPSPPQKPSVVTWAGMTEERWRLPFKIWASSNGSIWPSGYGPDPETTGYYGPPHLRDEWLASRRKVEAA